MARLTDKFAKKDAGKPQKKFDPNSIEKVDTYKNVVSQFYSSPDAEIKKELDKAPNTTLMGFDISERTVYQVPIDLLKPAPFGWDIEYRKLTDEELLKLCASILKIGMLHPIIVWHRNDDGYYVLAGHNRLRAYQILRESYPDRPFEKIKSIIFEESELDKFSAHLIVTDTNDTGRGALSKSEKAAAIKARFEYYKHNNNVDEGLKSIAEKYQMTVRNLYNWISLGNLNPKLMELFNRDMISHGSAIKLSKFSGPVQSILAGEFLNDLNDRMIAKLNPKYPKEKIRSILTAAHDDFKQKVNVRAIYIASEYAEEARNRVEAFIKEIEKEYEQKHRRGTENASQNV